MDNRSSRKKVLIVDDDSSVRRLVQATIRSDQIELLEAADGERAWILIQEHRPDVVLLDVQMPKMNGMEVLRAIRATPDLAGIHVIMLTAQAQDKDVAAGLASGADLYLTKPFSPLELLTLVEQSLGLA